MSAALPTRRPSYSQVDIVLVQMYEGSLLKAHHNLKPRFQKFFGLIWNWMLLGSLFVQLCEQQHAECIFNSDHACRSLLFEF